MPFNLLDLLKPQFDGMHEMYEAGFKAGIAYGRQQVLEEFSVGLKQMQEELNNAQAPTPDQDGVREGQD